MSPDNCFSSRHQPRDSLKALCGPHLYQTQFFLLLYYYFTLYNVCEWVTLCEHNHRPNWLQKHTKKNMLTFSTKQKKTHSWCSVLRFYDFSSVFLSKGILLFYCYIDYVACCKKKHKMRDMNKHKHLLYLHSIETLQAQLITHAHYHWILKENLLLYGYDVISYDYLWKVKYNKKIKLKSNFNTNTSHKRNTSKKNQIKNYSEKQREYPTKLLAK